MSRALVLGLLLLALALPAAACGSGGGGLPSGNAQGMGPSQALVTWPPAGFLTDHPSVRVRGTAADPDGVAAVTVQGIAATSADGFAHWEAQVPLVLGAAPLVVDVEDALGSVTSDAAAALVAHRQPYVAVRPQRLAWDAAGLRHLVLDRQRRAIVAVDPATGAGGEVSGPLVGAGPDFLEPTDLVLDPTTPTQAYAVDSMQDAVFAVDLLTGDRTIVSGLGVGTGAVLVRPVSLAYDAAASRLLVGDANADGLVGVDLATGNRTEISGPAVGMGPALSEPERLAVWQGKALVTESVQRLLIAVDLGTGDRAVVSNFMDAGQGPTASSPNGLLVDGATDTAYFCAFPGRVYEIDLLTGLRTLFSGPGLGAGAELRNPVLLTHGPGPNELSVFDWEHGGIYEIDRATRDRTEVYRPVRGSGSPLERPQGVAVAADGLSLYVLDLYEHMQQVDIASGDRSAVPFAGTPFVSPQSLASDAAGDRLFLRALVGGQPVIHELDLLAGTNTVISGDGLGTGPTDQWQGLAYDPLQDRLLIARFQPGSVLAVDPLVGDRVELSGPAVGAGPVMTASDVDVDPATGVIYAVSGNGNVLAVDPTTGDRTLVTGGGVGTGPVISNGNASRVAFDATAGRMLVVSWGQVFIVDLATGDRTVLSDVASGVGPALSTLVRDIALDTSRGVLWIVDNGTNAVVAVDLVSGDRVVIAR